MSKKKHLLYDQNSQAIIFNNQPKAIQRMLDFDYLVGRSTPSVAAVVHPSRSQISKYFFGHQEILIPVYKTLEQATQAHNQADVLINFSSFRSAYKTSKQALDHPQIKTIVIIAEGVPERQARKLLHQAQVQKKSLIGPATVGGILAGGFRIGNTGGSIDNIIASKLYRPGSVGFVSKSGGMSNEAYNIIAQNANGIYEGVAIGGDRFPGSTLAQHLIRMNQNPDIHLLVALGEVGGEDEYEVIQALEDKKITKPLVIWVTGTCADIFPTEVQFGHAGASSGEDDHTSARAKNTALKKAGALVPKSFDDLGQLIQKTFKKLQKQNLIPQIKEKEPQTLPQEYETLRRQNKIRKTTSIISSISDDRGPEATYHGRPISEFVEKNLGIGQVISHLWFKKQLPPKIAHFIEIVLIIVADHGPAVSGAQNAIVTSRAGKDIISSTIAGLLTIGPRFGGAIDGAARYFSESFQQGLSPQEFVTDMKKKGINIPGIGHKIKSVKNPDKRVEILKKYAQKNFPQTPILNYALEIEKITTQKRDNLILNVDGCIAACFLDLWFHSKHFTPQEANLYVQAGTLNGLFALGRTIGFMGHALDQKRLQQPLYRHPWDDILYLKDDE